MLYLAFVRVITPNNFLAVFVDEVAILILQAANQNHIVDSTDVEHLALALHFSLFDTGGNSISLCLPPYFVSIPVGEWLEPCARSDQPRATALCAHQIARRRASPAAQLSFVFENAKIERQASVRKFPSTKRTKIHRLVVHTSNVQKT